MNTDIDRGKRETREALAEYLRGPGDSPNPGPRKIVDRLANRREAHR